MAVARMGRGRHSGWMPKTRRGPWRAGEGGLARAPLRARAHRGHDLGPHTRPPAPGPPPPRLAPAGGFRPGPAPGPSCRLPVAAGSWSTFDPGPLASRSEAVGVWTGHEMVVVGGLVGYAAGADGAAYDPQTGRWHMIAPRPDA